MVVDAKERAQINAAHGVPSNLRDASGSVYVPSWKKPATQIQVPRNPPILLNDEQRTEKTGLGYSEFSKHNLAPGGSTSIGNKTARQTLTARQPPPKRQKFQHFEDARGTDNPRRSERKSSTVVINVDEDEVHVVTDTPDRLDMLDTPATVKEIRKHKADPPPLMLDHDDEYDDDDLQLISPPQHASGSRTLLDGDATRSLEEQINLDSDPIEEHSSPSLVQRRVADIENRNLPKDSIKRLDLRSVTGKAPSPVKKKMKGKNGKAKPLSTEGPMPAPVPFVRPRKSPDKLPFAKGYFGLELKHSSDYSISWEKEKLTFWDRNEEILWLTPSEVSESGCSMDRPYVVKITTKQTHQGYDKRKTEHFQLGGTRARGCITLFFDAVAVHKGYTAFTNWLKVMTPESYTSRGPAGVRMWKMAEESAEMAKQQASRQIAEAMQSKGSLKRSAPHDDGHDTTPPPVNEIFDDISSRSKPVSSSSRSSRIATRSNSEAVRRSARTQRSPAVDPEEVYILSPVSPGMIVNDFYSRILCYPQGVPGAVYIKNSDYRRLDPGEYLNDTLIEFGLKLWLNNLQESDPDLASEIHVFSSFFYKKLNNRNADEGYDSVRKWTAKIDIFSKKYIIVPINEHLHWYLVIIYQPEHVLLPPPPPAISSSPATRSQKKKPNPATDQLLPTIAKPPSIDLSRPTSPPPSPTSSGLSDPSEDIEAIQSNDAADEQSVTEGLLSLESSDLAEVEAVAVPIQAVSSAGNNSSDSKMDDALSPPGSPMMITDGLTISTAPTEVDFDMDRPLSPTVSDYTEEKKPIEIHDVDLQDSQNPESLPDEKDDSISISTSIAPGNFYGKSSKAFGKQRAIPNTMVPRKDNDRPTPVTDREDENDDDDEGDQPTLTATSENTTYIFTFDSLGSKHPQAIRNLARYLKKEAQDKLNKNDTSTAVGKLAHERTKTKDKQTRHEDWKGELTGDMRERLRADIDKLSVEWKKDRAAKEEAKRLEESAGCPSVEVIESSDDDVDIVETRLPTPTPGATTGKKSGKRKTVVDDAPVMRLR
ncbi:hypothetical protein H0H92_009621 [Tricholoma furcatifolium]|nr:hypothetical protein H0H92_009621 [Tricholoma furcatifolium]